MEELGSIRMYITESCNANCKNCFNKNNRSSASMNIQKFEALCSYFKELHIDSIKIMGGEPTIHPDFLSFMILAQSYFKKVSLFTNAINDELQYYLPRESDSITYNFKFSKVLNKQKMLLNKPGKRFLEVQIGYSTNIEKLIQDIIRITDFNPHKIAINLTLDCTSNIFADKSLILPKYISVVNALSVKGLHIRTDHKIPLCFLYKSGLQITSNSSNCTFSCCGLIDSKYNVRHCNQYGDILINMFDDNDNIIEPEFFYNHLYMAHNRLQILCFDKICKECIFFQKQCNGGCFIAKNNIKREDIIENTQFPII